MKTRISILLFFLLIIIGFTVYQSGMASFEYSINATPLPLTQTANMLYWCSNYDQNCPTATPVNTLLPYPGILNPWVTPDNCTMTYPGLWECDTSIFSGAVAQPEIVQDEVIQVDALPSPSPKPMRIARPGRHR